MSAEKKNETGVVVWHLEAKNLIKIEGHDNAYKLSDIVLKASDFKKYPLSKGSKITYEVKDGLVTFLRKEADSTIKTTTEPVPEKEQPKPEPSKSETPVSKPVNQGDPVAQIYTVFAMAGNKKVCKLEKDGPWVQISETLQALDYKTLGLVTKGNIKGVIVNNILLSCEALESISKDAEPDITRDNAPKQEHKRGYSDNVQVSIEAQAAVNSANNLVGRIASTLIDKPPASKINEMISVIAEANYELIQKLKSK